MANEVQYAYPTGQSIYAVALNSSAKTWSSHTSAFETPTTADWQYYGFALTEQGTASGIYTASFPSFAADTYTVFVYLKLGASPASTDTVLASGQLAWNGSSDRFLDLLSYVDGQYTYNPATGVVTFYDPTGSTEIMTATLTFDGSGNITARTLAFP